MTETIVKKFYDELTDGKLVGLKCPECGTVSFPPKATCNTCGNFDLEWLELSGKGELNIYSVVNYPGGEFQELAPYAVGFVKLEEGPMYCAMVDGVDLDEPWEGNKNLPVAVTATIEKIGTKNLPVFHAAK